ncbi:hypothetical protein KUCAC02_007899 [Chaenocephalus aceratus]|uniref:Uncharacterized protein n=1 Tax=Chaenocephalus aceratus TaxID=36190 RepID=A0ACB9X7T1_CHAAC|nr:hypothetical protein KUCAC02_007899 [Chaenocephalus aceratus]
MPKSQETSEIKMEEVPLNTIPGTGGTTVISISERCAAASCCEDRNHRILAICSIICGLSCIGIPALINSVKAENTTGQERNNFLKRARKCGIISIAVWFAILVSIPILMAIISYIITLKE